MHIHLTILLHPFPSRNSHQLRLKRTRDPDGAPSICRSIFTRLSRQRCCLTHQSGPECHTDTTELAGNHIYTPNVTLQPLEMHIIGSALDCSDLRKRNNAVSKKVVKNLTAAKCKPEFLNVNTSFLLSPS